MKVYISQPIVDKTDEQFIEEVNKAITHFEDFDDIEIINSSPIEMPKRTTELWRLGESIKLLGEADVVYFCKDWEYYRSCAIEHECAVRYGIQCVYA